MSYLNNQGLSDLALRLVGAKADELTFKSADGSMTWTVKRGEPFFDIFHQLPAAKRDTVMLTVNHVLGEAATELGSSLGNCPESIFSALSGIRYFLGKSVNELAATTSGHSPFWRRLRRR